MTAILLTGGPGFIGHHTVEHILENTDFEIILVDRLNYAGNLNRITTSEIVNKNKSRVHWYYHDIRAAFAPEHIAYLKSKYPKVTHIINMAAETHVDNSITSPEPFIYTNFVGAFNMLELARRLEPETFIQISTDEVYGPATMHEGHLQLHAEGEPHLPSNPYSATKAGAEDLAYSYWNTYGLPVMITNTMNNYGERQDKEKFVPKVIKGLLNRQPLTFHCKLIDGKVIDVSSRCWLHARNHADALLFLLEHGKCGKRYNVVGEWMPVDQLAKLIAQYLGITSFISNYVDFHSFRPGHDMHYGLDGLRMRLMGWQPPVSLETSLEKTVHWIMNNPEWIE